MEAQDRVNTMEAQDPEPILNSLNKAQRRAVTSNAPTVAILAGPGSGKTHTLTARVVWLVRQTGYQPADIIVATFTVKAAREMKERIGKRLGGESGKKIVLGTFHSIARRYLSAYGTKIGLDSKFGIADDGDSRAIIQRICKRLDLQIEPAYAKSWISKKKSKGTALVQLQTGKRPQENPSLNVCYKEYQEHLARANLLDYDDLLVKCVELLQDHPSCVANVQAVLIDEYQDTNGIQYELMRLFAQARQQITIVGDPDQSIYGWRSAEIKNLYRLLRDYPETDEVSLEENYRSSQSILDLSLNVIQQDKKRYQKVLKPAHTKSSKPVLRKLRSASAEGEWVVSELRRATAMFGGALRNEDVAILLRSASLSRHIESALGKAGVPYHMIGGHKFYERKEVKILLDYLRVVYQPDNNDAVARVINVPRRGIGEATIKALLEEAEQTKLSLWSLLWRHCRGGRQVKTKIRQSMEQKLNSELLKIVSNLRQKAEQITESSSITLVDLIDQLATQLNFKKYLEAEYTEDHEQRWANVQELMTLASDFIRDIGKADEDELPEIDNLEQAKDDDILGRFLANIALASDAQTDDKVQDKASQVTISTIHAAKGLEWPVVFVPSVYEGSIPHSRSEDMDEERRLLYVAMTRAQALLYLSCPMYGSQGLSNKVELSPFVSPFAAHFAQKGPSFDRPVLDSVGTILNRIIPAEKAIFDRLPAMFCPEDDQFPIDPFDPKDPDGLQAAGLDSHDGRPPKRQKTIYASTSESSVTERHWKPDYSTTMDKASEFTMPAMPGFVTAGAHQSALAAAASVPKPNGVSNQTNSKRVGRYGGGTTRRRPDQRSLLGFVTMEQKHPEELETATPASNRDTVHIRHHSPAAHMPARNCSATRPGSAETTPSIDPQLANHKLPTGKVMTRPTMPKPTNEEPSKGYACFSSSPPRITLSEERKEDTSSNSTRFQRPAISFHATTFQTMKPQGDGIRRPVGLGPPPSMDRLRKPFKPLTINRPQKPASRK